MNIQLNCVLKGVGDAAPLPGLHRVLWINIEDDLLFTIEIPTRAPAGATPRYYKGPKRRSLGEVQVWVSAGSVSVTTVQPLALATWSDEKIRERYPMRNAPMLVRAPRTDSAAIQHRDERWHWVEPICRFIDSHPADAYEHGRISAEVKRRAKELGRERVEIYDALHRVLAHACGRNSIQPAYSRCGGPGQPRQPRVVSKLGRPSAAYLLGKVDSPGIHLTEEQKRFIGVGFDRFLKAGKSVEEAYILTMGAWWSTGSKIDDGIEIPILLPANERPTLAQFRYWGPRVDGGRAAYELLLAEGEWERNLRSVTGTSLDGLNGVGQLGVGDATGTHVTLVSMASPLDALGPAHRIVIHDGLSDVITGFYVGLEAPSQATVDLAAYMSVIDKVDLCSQFGVTITSDQIPACHYRKLRVDNGEWRNEASIAKTTASGSALELVQRKRPERKQQAESGHHVMHAKLDDHLDGATHGRAPSRGQDHSAVAACHTWYSYTAIFLRGVVYFNCVLDASGLMARHPFRTEMMRDGVKPTRAAIHAWCVANNRVGSPACDVEVIRSRSLPEFRATVKRSGIYLCRPDRGRKDELVVGPRYSGPRAVELRWHEGQRKDFQITVRMDPHNPNRLYYSDELGIHKFDNLSQDQLARREAALHDLLAMQDAEAVQRTVARSESDQGQSDFVSHREHTNLARRAEKKKAIEATPGRVTKSRLKANLSSNRQKEAQRIAEQIDPYTRAPNDIESRRPKARGDLDLSPAVMCDGGSAPAVLNQDAAGVLLLDVQSLDAGDRDSDSNSVDVVTDALAALRARRRSR